MAKKRGPSIHSRAARRATSPSIDTDKSLKDIKPPSRSSTARPSVLAVHQSAGVQKKVKNGRKSQMSAKARRRHEKGLEMAEAVIERTSKKVEKSVGRGRAVKQRSKNWEDINKVAEAGDKMESDDSDNDNDDDAAAAEGNGAPVDVGMLAQVEAEIKTSEMPAGWIDDGDEDL